MKMAVVLDKIPSSSTINEAIEILVLEVDNYISLQ